MTNHRDPDFLDNALKRATRPRPVDEAAVARVLQHLAPPLPRQKFSLRRLPGVLLDWRFAPAWPRVAALVACAMLGFFVGIEGLDRRFDQVDAPYVIAGNADLGSVFDPEPLSGARP